jgi:hypothetical protein
VIGDGDHCGTLTRSVHVAAPPVSPRLKRAIVDARDGCSALIEHYGTPTQQTTLRQADRSAGFDHANATDSLRRDNPLNGALILHSTR